MLEETNLSRESFLSVIGLKEVMIEKDYIDPFDNDLFHRYTSQEYLHSSSKEGYEVHRTSEVVLLNTAIDLRAVCLTTENNNGDELRYRLRDVFILTNKGTRVEERASI